jgi:hypothetical protein
VTESRHPSPEPASAASHNGTYRSSLRNVTRPEHRGRTLALVGLVLMLVGSIGATKTNADMVALERAGGERLAEVGSGLNRLLPSIFTSLSKANAAFNSPTRTSNPNDPRTAPAYVDLKRWLERWVAVAGVGFACLLFGLDEMRGVIPPPGPEGSVPRHVPITTDVARFVLMAAAAWGALSFFETGG